VAELEARKLSSPARSNWTRPISVGGARASAAEALLGKAWVFGLLERDGRVYTKVVENVSAETLMTHICANTRKGSVYYTDAYKGYQSLKRYRKHHTVNHTKGLVDRRTKNHINGIEGFWSFGKHILYSYRGVSKYHFPMYLKEIEYRFNHRRDNLFRLFLHTFFGYVSV
jgi:transposase